MTFVFIIYGKTLRAALPFSFTRVLFNPFVLSVCSQPLKEVVYSCSIFTKRVSVWFVFLLWCTMAYNGGGGKRLCAATDLDVERVCIQNQTSTFVWTKMAVFCPKPLSCFAIYVQNIFVYLQIRRRRVRLN